MSASQVAAEAKLAASQAAALKRSADLKAARQTAIKFQDTASPKTPSTAPKIPVLDPGHVARLIVAKEIEMAKFETDLQAAEAENDAFELIEEMKELITETTTKIAVFGTVSAVFARSVCDLLLSGTPEDWCANQLLTETILKAILADKPQDIALTSAKVEEIEGDLLSLGDLAMTEKALVFCSDKTKWDILSAYQAGIMIRNIELAKIFETVRKAVWRNGNVGPMGGLRYELQDSDGADVAADEVIPDVIDIPGAVETVEDFAARLVPLKIAAFSYCADAMACCLSTFDTPTATVACFLEHAEDDDYDFWDAVISGKVLWATNTLATQRETLETEALDYFQNITFECARGILHGTTTKAARALPKAFEFADCPVLERSLILGFFTGCFYENDAQWFEQPAEGPAEETRQTE